MTRLATWKGKNSFVTYEPGTKRVVFYQEQTYPTNNLWTLYSETINGTNTQELGTNLTKENLETVKSL